MLLITANATRAIMLEHFAEARVYVTSGLISLTVPRTGREIVMRVIIISPLPSGTRQLALAVQTNVTWKIVHHDISILPLDHRSLPAPPFFLHGPMSTRSCIREAWTA